MAEEMISVHPFRGSYQIRKKHSCPECGSFKYEVKDRTDHVQWIFCKECRKWSSIPLIFYDRPY